MNYQENEQLEGEQSSTQRNQNPKGQPLSGEVGGTLDENSGQKEDWSDEESMSDKEDNLESDIVEEEEGDELDEDVAGDGLTQDYDQDEIGTEPDGDEDEVRNQTMI